MCIQLILLYITILYDIYYIICEIYKHISYSSIIKKLTFVVVSVVEVVVLVILVYGCCVDWDVVDISTVVAVAVVAGVVGVVVLLSTVILLLSTASAALTSTTVVLVLSVSWFYKFNNIY